MIGGKINELIFVLTELNNTEKLERERKIYIYIYIESRELINDKSKIWKEIRIYSAYNCHHIARLLIINIVLCFICSCVLIP